MTTTTPSDTPAEAAAHQTLRLIADHPRTCGRLGTASILGGKRIAAADDYTRYAAPISGWTLRDMVDLVDALIHGGLIAQTQGASPTLALTRAGFRALDALDTQLCAEDI